MYLYFYCVRICISTVFGEFFLRLNREDQVPMLAVEISRCALVSHRGADSRHDSPTELGQGEGEGGIKGWVGVGWG